MMLRCVNYFTMVEFIAIKKLFFVFGAQKKFDPD
jgi:hypothetical protein